MKWNEFIGQVEIKDELETILAAYKLKKNNMPIPHVLFYGGWGMGKTTLAKLFAVRSEKDYYYTAKREPVFPLDKDIYILDEIHKVSAQEELYPLLDNDEEDRKIIIGCTTKIGKMDLPFRSRFIEFSFQDYAEEELMKIIKVHIQNYPEVIFDDKILYEIAKRSRGVPRIARILAYRLIRFFRVYKKEPNLERINEIFSKYGIDEIGLTNQDRRYMDALKRANKPLGLTTLSAMTGLDTNTIQLIVEPFLFRLGLAAISSSGRILLQDCYEVNLTECARSIYNYLYEKLPPGENKIQVSQNIIAKAIKYSERMVDYGIKELTENHNITTIRGRPNTYIFDRDITKAQ